MDAFRSLMHARHAASSQPAASASSTNPLRTPTTLLFQARPELEETPKISSFQQRLLDRMNAPNKKIMSQNAISKHRVQTSNMQEVQTLKDFKRVVIDETPDDQLVVVWFYSPWCRSCKGVSKGIQALSREYGADHDSSSTSIKFVQVPVLSENATLHQGLGVKSVPFVHLYHPTAGLVEERKLTRKYLPGFHRLLRDYRSGSCSLEQMRQGEESQTFVWSTESPYEPVSKAKDEDDE